MPCRDEIPVLVQRRAICHCPRPFGEKKPVSPGQSFGGGRGLPREEKLRTSIDIGMLPPALCSLGEEAKMPRIQIWRLPNHRKHIRVQRWGVNDGKSIRENLPIQRSLCQHDYCMQKQKESETAGFNLRHCKERMCFQRSRCWGTEQGSTSVVTISRVAPDYHRLK